MKKIICLAFLLFVTNSKAQIAFEFALDSASDYNDNELVIIKFELEGERYVKINRQGNNMSIYNLNHSLTKTISFASYPPHVGNFLVLYPSQLLFNSDSLIEFLYGYNDATGMVHTRIYNENGTALFIGDSLFSEDEVAIPQQEFTIYNTSAGTKMILSHRTNGKKYIYSLGGTLTTAIDKTSHSFTGNMGNAYPNPTVNTTTIPYTLPQGINNGEVIFYNTQGTEVKRFKVDNTFSSLLVTTTDIPAGTYYYQLQTGGNASGTKKMVVVK